MGKTYKDRSGAPLKDFKRKMKPHSLDGGKNTGRAPQKHNASNRVRDWRFPNNSKDLDNGF